MTDKQPDALALADHLEQFRSFPDDLAAAAELRRLYDENEAKDALLRQARDTMAYWLEHGETPGSHDMIQRTHDALQERLK